MFGADKEGSVRAARDVGIATDGTLRGRIKMIRFLILSMWVPLSVGLAVAVAILVGAPLPISFEACRPDLERAAGVTIELKVLKFSGAPNVVLWRPFTESGRRQFGDFWRGIQHNRCGNRRARALYTPTEALSARTAP